MPVEFSRGDAPVAVAVDNEEAAEGPWPILSEVAQKAVEAAVAAVVDAAEAGKEEDDDACLGLAVIGGAALGLASLVAAWTALERIRPG